MPRRVTVALLLMIGAAPAACEGTMAGLSPASSGHRWEGAVPACPVDPDCGTTGSCSEYECPDHWQCRSTGATVQCANPGPDYPDDGGGWSCRDESGSTVCRRTEGDYPAPGGGDGWSCERTMGGEIVCRDPTPSHPPDAGDAAGSGTWACGFDEGLRVCSRSLEGAPDGAAGGGTWSCTTAATGGTRCTQSSPGTPDGSASWTCYELAGTVACTGRSEPAGEPSGDRGDDWSCAEDRGHETCTDSHPDYPDAGGSGAWECRYDEAGIRSCESDTPRPGAGEPPSDSTPPSAPGSPPGSSPSTPSGPPPSTPPAPRDCSGDDPECEAASCAPGERSSARFRDDQDGSDDGEIVVFSDRSPEVSCATVTVERTGWYRIHDRSLAESCGSQRDETAFLTVTSSCRPDGLPLEHNAGDRFVRADLDNRACSSDSECGAGLACLAPRHGAGTCCTPAEPVFMGTFLLRAGEPNRLCLHHWCPVWQSEGRAGGFVQADCRDAMNSVHFRLDESAFACAEDLTVPPECR
ncbi:MAG: hypothetical protein IT379_14175 [Deltaproteobacteria bacterium]|nr:hypothetical protein [Deltaproteobacteria bacterium]